MIILFTYTMNIPVITIQLVISILNVLSSIIAASNSCQQAVIIRLWLSRCDVSYACAEHFRSEKPEKLAGLHTSKYDQMQQDFLVFLADCIGHSDCVMGHTKSFAGILISVVVRVLEHTQMIV